VPNGVSRTVAQAKIRKQRANRGVSNPMQYDNNLSSKDYSMMNSSAISHERQQSLQNTTPGIVNPNSFMNDHLGLDNDVSGGRKPTADSIAYPLYNQNGQKVMRGKFSNGGGSIDGANP
jgi:hypothetical protein